MENPCKIIFFGDSIIKGCAPIFEKAIKEEYPNKDIEIIYAGVSGETSQDGLIRIDQLKDESPQVVVIGFGMNDWRKGISKKEFRENISKIVDEFDKNNVRVILVTINPDYQGFLRGTSKEVDEYTCIIREVAREKRLKIADVNSLWKREIKPVQRGLRDAIHPNSLGYRVICKSLMYIVPRRNTVVLWQYNGHEAKCNYRCPYCYYIGLHHPSDKFFGTIEQWHRGFKESFGNQHLVFYLAFGEPTIGISFYDIVEMVDSEPNWELRITSNVSQPMENLVKSKSTREGRLHINASFHPLTVSIDEFLNKILFLRERGIEISVVYVAYPPFLKRLESDIAVFSEHNFVVHVRRFQGNYRGKEYPYAYTDEERRLIAKFSDDGMIKYMLNQQHNTGDLTYSGLHFFVVDSVGNVGYDSNVFAPYTKYRCIFGNIHQGNFCPLFKPGPYPGRREGTVDGVANLVEANYHELEGNNVLSFARQGGVYRNDNGVFYKNLHTDFTDSRIRAEYNFSPRGIKDGYFMLRYLGIRKFARLIKQAKAYSINLIMNHRFIRDRLRFIKWVVGR
jgi:acyl-CoA thioesterase-1